MTARDIVAEVDELSWRCRKRSPFHKASAWIFLCGVKPAGRTSEPFDESSARIFVRGDPGTSNFRAI